MGRFSDLTVRISGQADGFKRAMAEVNRDLATSAKNTSAATGGYRALGASLTDLAIPLVGMGAGLGVLASKALSAFGTIDQLKRGLTAVTGSAATAERQFEELGAVAKLPGLGLKEAARGAVNLQALGFSFTQSKRFLLEFGNALAVVGRGREDLDEVIRQLGQMGARGVVTADNLKPLIERVPQLASIIKDKFGAEALANPAEAFKKLGINAQGFFDIILTELEKGNRATGGIKNAFENMSDTIQKALGEAGKAAAPAASALVDGFLVPSIEKAAAAAKAFSELSDSQKNFTFAMAAVPAATGLAVIGIVKVIEGLGALKIALLGNPLTAGALALGMVVMASKAKLLADELSELQKRMKATADTEKELPTTRNTHWLSAAEQADILAGKLTQLDAQQMVTQRSGAALKDIVFEFAGSLPPATKGAGALSGSLGGVADGMKKVNQQLTAEGLLAGITQFNNAVEATRKFKEEIALADKQAKELAEHGYIAIASDEAIEDFLKLGKQAKETTEDLLVLNATLATPPPPPRKVPSAMPIPQLEKDTQKAVSISERFSRQVSLITNDMARDLADLVFKGGKFKDVMSGVFENVGKSIARAAIETQLGRISKLFTDMIGNGGKLGSVLGAVFGNGTSVLSSAAKNAGGAILDANGNVLSTVGGGIKSASGGAGSAVSGALGSVSAITGIVTGIASAASGIISNFQQAGMNKSLDLIVNHTLRIANQLIEGLQPQINAYLPFLQSIHERLQTVVDRGIGVYDAATGSPAARSGGGGPTVINNYFQLEGTDPYALANQITRIMKLQAAV